MSINGTYKIVEMEAWSKDAVDLVIFHNHSPT